MPNNTRAADIAEWLADRFRIYDLAAEADVARARAQFGTGPTLDALRLLNQPPPKSQWDANGHKREVASGLQRVLISRALARQSDLGE